MNYSTGRSPWRVLAMMLLLLFPALAPPTPQPIYPAMSVACPGPGGCLRRQAMPFTHLTPNATPIPKRPPRTPYSRLYGPSPWY